MRAAGFIALGFVGGAAVVLGLMFAFGVRMPSPGEVRVSAAANGAKESKAANVDTPEPPAVLSYDPMAALDATQRVALMRWMQANPQYKFVVRDYCDCAGYHEAYPYLSAIDLNGDKHGDIAVLFAERGKGEKEPGETPHAFFVFSGPFGEATPEPAYARTGWGAGDVVFGSYVGLDESDNGYLITRKGRGYELVYTGDPG